MLQLVTCTGLGGPADGTRQFQRYLMPLGLHTNQTSSDTQIGTLIDSSSRKSQLLPSVLMSTDPICQIYIYQTGKKLQDYLGSLDILNSTWCARPEETFSRAWRIVALYTNSYLSRNVLPTVGGHTSLDNISHRKPHVSYSRGCCSVSLSVYEEG